MLEKWIKNIMSSINFSYSFVKILDVQYNWMVDVYIHTSKDK